MALCGKATMTDPDIVVLRKKVHGMPTEEYAAELRERFPDKTVAFASTPDEEAELLSQTRVATGHSVDPTALDDDADLDYFACIYAGTGHLALDEFEARGIAVTNAAGVHGPNIAEHVLGNILAFTRGFNQAWRQKERREWRSFQAHELMGSTVAVVGLGAIGEEIVDRLDAFDVHTVGVRYSPEKGGPTDEVFGFGEIHEAVADASYVVLACPLTDETRGLVDASVFDSMRSDAVLVNIARGPVVDTDDLLAALRVNSIRGAALDVTDPEPLPEAHELWNFDNVFVTPHNAGHTPKYFDRMADILGENLELADERGEFTELKNQVI